MSPAGRFVVPIIAASAKGQAVCGVVLRAHISGRGDAALSLRAFCFKLWDANTRRSSITPISLSQYEEQLSVSEDQMKSHQMTIVAGIECLIEFYKKPGSVIPPQDEVVPLKFNWHSAKQNSFKITKSAEVNKKMPGWRHYAMHEYKEDFGDLATNGMLQRGHRRWRLDGKDGVLVFDREITEINFSEKIAATLDSEATGGACARM